MTRDPDRFDALIVGARCAGSATALLMARAGMRVLLIDRAPAIGDTLSTHAIMRPGIVMLDRLGVLPAIWAADTPAVTRTRFYYGTDVADIPVRPVGTAPGLCAPRRHVLDRILCDAAVAAGADLSLGTAFEGVRRNTAGRVTGADIRLPDGHLVPVLADIVIGADGRTSRVAEAVGASLLHTDATRAATVFGYFDGVPDEGFRWYFDRRVQAGVIPTNGGQHCIFASCAPTAFGARFGEDTLNGLAAALRQWEPEISATLLAVRPETRLRRYPGSRGHIRDCAGPGWALVGDAGYYKDPATAHGISDALLDAGRLADTWLRSPDRLDRYRAERDAHAGDLFEITQSIASFDWDLDTLATLHQRLNARMKAEVASIGEGAEPRTIAA